MRATEYLKEFPGTDPGMEDLIINRLFEEAQSLAKKRNCHGGDSTFGTYADCFREQFVKWQAICRRQCAFNPENFVKMLFEKDKQLFQLMDNRGDFREIE